MAHQELRWPPAFPELQPCVSCVCQVAPLGIFREPPHFMNSPICISQLHALPPTLSFLSGHCPSCLKCPGQNFPSLIPSFLLSSSNHRPGAVPVSSLHLQVPGLSQLPTVPCHIALLAPWPLFCPFHLFPTRQPTRCLWNGGLKSQYLTTSVSPRFLPFILFPPPEPSSLPRPPSLLLARPIPDPLGSLLRCHFLATGLSEPSPHSAGDVALCHQVRCLSARGWARSAKANLPAPHCSSRDFLPSSEGHGSGLQEESGR